MAKSKKANGKAKKANGTKKAQVHRTRMNDEAIEKFIKHYAKAHDLKGKELDSKLRRVAASRLAALERNARAAQ